jgi:hypothetical protein
MEKGFVRKQEPGTLVFHDNNRAADRAFALEHYDKFLRGANLYMSVKSKDEGRRMAMISCLLVVSKFSLQRCQPY